MEERLECSLLLIFSITLTIALHSASPEGPSLQLLPAHLEQVSSSPGKMKCSLHKRLSTVPSELLGCDICHPCLWVPILTLALLFSQTPTIVEHSSYIKFCLLKCLAWPLFSWRDPDCHRDHMPQFALPLQTSFPGILSDLLFVPDKIVLVSMINCKANVDPHNNRPGGRTLSTCVY